MAARYELREAGTRRLLGTVQMEDDLSPGAVSRLLTSGQVQVEEPAPRPAPAGEPGDNGKSKRRK